MKKILKKIGENIVAFFLGVSLSIVLGESIVRVFDLAYVLENDADIFFESRDGFGYIGKKNIENFWSTPEFRIKVKHNSLGFRDEEHPLSKSNGKRRIIALGDSFTWGWGIKDDEVYTERMEGILENTEVINMAVPGYGIAQEFNVLKQFALKYEPNIIIVGFFLDDFLSEDLFALSEEHYSFRNFPICFMYPELIDLKRNFLGSLLTAQGFLRGHSALYNFAAQKIKTSHQLEWLRGGLAGQGLMKGDPPFSIAASLSLNKKDKWKYTENALIRMKKISDSHNSKLLVAIIPEKSQIYEKFWPLIVSKYKIKMEDLFLPNKYINEACEKNNILAIDLFQEFKRHADMGEKLYFDYDPHWNSKGHELAANLISDFIKKHEYSGVK